jgi:hypothetical protein
MPLRQGGFFGVFSVFIRTQDPQSAAAVVRGKLREIDAALPAYDIRPMQDWVDNNSGAARMRTWAIALLAAVALALGMIGIYGVLAYLVTLRSHEFGVRLALGAKPGDVLCMVLGKGLALAAARHRSGDFRRRGPHPQRSTLCWLECALAIRSPLQVSRPCSCAPRCWLV